jgi:hypothetical protein
METRQQGIEPPVLGVQAGGLAEDDEQQLQQATNLFSEFFEREPNTIQTFERIFDQHLRRQVDTETGRLLFKSISIYAGEDNARFLWRFMKRAFDDPEYRARVESYFNEKVRTCMHSFLALYGRDFNEVYELQNENPNGWRFLYRRVYYNLTSGQWQIVLRIYKYNGEVTLYEEVPTGWLSLADSILSIINEIPTEAAQGIIDQDVIERFKSTYATFLELFTVKSSENGNKEDNYGHTENS